MARVNKNLSKADILRGSLERFFENNPSASVVEFGKSKKFYGIERPWNDDSVAFLVPEKDAEKGELIETLNNVHLPPRLSALYHPDRNQLEIIFTARALSKSLQALDKRAFEFNFRGRMFPCVFDASSERLMVLAKHVFYPLHSQTAFRNLVSFSNYAARPMDQKASSVEYRRQFGRPISFYIGNIEWDEEGTLEVLRHISFYLTYYDSVSPFILIHPPDDPMLVKPKLRYCHGDFPEKISSRELNPTLLSFWVAAADAEPDKKFLYYFRIIEFVASNYLKGEKLSEVKKILAAPDLASRLDTSIDSLVGLIREEKPDGVNRFKAVVTELVDRKLIWQEICENPQGFTQSLEFDGGFKLPKVVDDTSDISKLGPNGPFVIAGQIRDIRNALAHGGEAQAGRVILPTARNVKMLLPWVHLISVIAGEVVLYEHHT